MSYSPTTPINSYATADAYLKAGRNRNDRPAPSGNRTRIVRDFIAPDSISVVYHQTPIVTYLAANPDVVRLDAGGWFTKTTVERMREYLPRDWEISLNVLRQDRHGRGEGIAVIDRITREHPGEPRVQTCRTCHGSRVSKWSETSRCYRCAGTGYVDYGSNLTAIEWTQGTGWAHSQSLFTINEVGMSPDYPCGCEMCAGGFSSWQEMHAARRWAA